MTLSPLVAGPLLAGIDMATAEVRVTVADAAGRVVGRGSSPLAAPVHPRPGWSEQDATTWWPAVARSLQQAAQTLDHPIVAVSVAATSGTVVVADRSGEPIGPALLYDDARVPAPQRWAWLVAHAEEAVRAAHAWHASDLVVSRLIGEAPPTDWSHALKTGFDPASGHWTTAEPEPARRPAVAAPTSPAGTVSRAAAVETGLQPGCHVRLGMTDGCAAQLGAGADRPGRFVTVLGTTMVVKGATRKRIDDASSGVYSHRHPDGWWLPGGASNTGGGSLASRFRDTSLSDLDRRATERGPATVTCYPASGRGERFPFVTAAADELWTGSPEDDVDAYRAVLEGVAFVERLGYERLRELGSTVEQPLRSAGGGSGSDSWTAIRATVLGMEIVRPSSAETAFGACMLAAAGTLHPDLGAATDAMAGTPGEAVTPVEQERDRLDETYGRFVEALVKRGWLT